MTETDKLRNLLKILPTASPGAASVRQRIASLTRQEVQEKQSLALRDQIRSCRNCELNRTRKHAVPFSGPTHGKADLILIGEAPGATEDRTGIPFTGASGHLLDDLLITAGTHRDKCYVVNTLCCRPPGNRDPEKEEMDACRPNLNDQLALGDVKVGVCLGGYALAALMGWERQIIKVKNQLDKVYWVDGRLWVGTYHPSYALRNIGRADDYGALIDEEKPEIAMEIVKSLQWALAMRWGSLVPKIPWDRVTFNGVSGEAMGKALKKKRWALVDSQTFGAQIIVLQDEQSSSKLPRSVEHLPRYTVDELWRLGEIGSNRGGWTTGDLRRLHIAKAEFDGEVVLG